MGMMDDATAGQLAEGSTLEQAILQTVAYVDMYDYPLTVAEIHRYLVCLPATETEVGQALENSHLVRRQLGKDGTYFFLAGREHIVETRRKREMVAGRLWPQALTYGRLASAIPYVKMVAVTGSLAVNNVDAAADIDFLIVTEIGRLWLCRAMIIMLVKLAAKRGVWLCPNYFLSTRALHFDDRNLFSAHEIVQMVPISGRRVFRQLLEENQWVTDFLPNAYAALQPLAHATESVPAPLKWGRKVGEAALRTPIGGRIERWEMNRKVSRFSQQPANETAFSADFCKGHFEDHGQRTLNEYASRIEKLAAEPGNVSSE
jgi:hypothetical protein